MKNELTLLISKEMAQKLDTQLLIFPVYLPTNRYSKHNEACYNKTN